jgi:hypothetical protein
MIVVNYCAADATGAEATRSDATGCSIITGAEATESEATESEAAEFVELSLCEHAVITTPATNIANIFLIILNLSKIKSYKPITIGKIISQNKKHL